MDGPRRDTLDDLVLAALDRIEGHGPDALDALCAEHPGQAEALRARMATLQDAGLLDEPGAPPERLGDFRLGERLGGGGMGVVYAATQESLDREVALKIIRADRLYFPGARERFRREVQLVARLAHPGIVPVHTVGEEQGVPYFAMERLRGATLAEALAELEQPARTGAELAEAVARVVSAREAGTAADAVEVVVDGALYAGRGDETVLRIVRRIADALAHAHERGVLHRDLKPSNVMLTTDGRALLIDFGLASSEASARLTESGSRVGSLAYMAPEQVRGDELDARSDVYGLGAILCEALTLAPPHTGSPDAVTAAVLAGEPSPFARRRSDLSRDLVTVVQTALAPGRDARYASAAALSRDLAHVLEGRPIEARRAGPARRLAAWARRHPARAGLAAAVVIAPVLFAVQQSLAADRVTAQSDRADENLERALAAIDTFVWDLGTGALEHVPHMDAARLAMFEEAAASLDALAAQRPGEDHLVCRAVRVKAALGTALLELGRLAEAEARFRAAIAQGEDHVHREETVPALNGLGNLLARRGQLHEARALFVQAAERIDVGRAPLDAAAVQRNVARMERRVGRPEDAVDWAERAVASAEAALARAPDEDARFEARFERAGALSQRAVPLRRAPGDATVVTDGTAHAAYERALPEFLALADERPRRSDVVHEAATASVQAVWYRAPVDAERELRAGLALIEGLRADYPDRADYARTEIALCTNLGHSLRRQGRLDESAAWYERASRAADPWVDREPDDVGFLQDAGRADVNLASNLVQRERRVEAAELAARGAARLERAARLLPMPGALRSEVAWARVQEGYGRLALGETARVRELAGLVPVAELADATLTIAVGELLAGCADATAEADEREALRTAALDHLARGLALGFAAYDYLETASEWAGLRDDPRFRVLLVEARE